MRSSKRNTVAIYVAVTRKLHDIIQEIAAEEGVSIAQIIREILKAKFARDLKAA